MASGSSKFYAGIDLGGTNIAVGVIDSRGKLIAKAKTPTLSKRGMKDVAARMAQSMMDLIHNEGIEKKNIHSLGIGSPGPLHTQKGIILQAPNLPGSTNFPLRAFVANKTKIHTVLDNDANAAAYAELLAGAGKGEHVRNMLMLTLGTGVGGAIILDRKLYHGTDTVAGELGHVSLKADGPTFGSPMPGSLEALASATGIARRAKELIKQGKGKKILKHAGGKLSQVDAKAVYLAFKQGDAAAKLVWRETAYWIGIACAGYINIFNPDMIVIGGGVMQGGKELLAMAKSISKKNAFIVPGRRVKMVAAKLGDDAGLIGAALVGRDGSPA